ncbi:unnamed protein product [Paramecium sonneborni]|uniref:Uncharacterized protein n=1 Tax=Paramecium sonneborni TaxID=65129 RepID=A0A8S1KIG4_9CILI|nr:unnamed protein product [Paramecium sonneborni]CAD8052906.1 unnamed protein product [Paramecium sonneborni]
MKKISTTHRIEKDNKTKTSISTHSLFNKVQQKMMTSKDQDIDKLKQVQEIDNKSKKEVVNKLHKYSTPNCGQFRIKTEASNYYFAQNNKKKSILNIPNLSNLEGVKTNNLSIFEQKTPRILLVRSEKYNQKQPLTQRLMCTYLKKQNPNSKLIKSNNKV